MPAPNDLSPEEEAMFAEHGVEPAGQGGEPVIENAGDEQQLDDGGQQPVEEQHGDRQPQPVAEVSRHREDGTFKTKEEFEADVAAAQAAQQGQQGQEQQQGQQQQPEKKFVPLEALHEARQREAEARRQAQTLMTRMNAILAQRQQQQGDDGLEQMPSLEEDPVGYIRAMENRLAAFERTRQEENQYREIDSAINQDEQMFTASVPDYDQASDHYVQSRAQELLAFHTPAEAQRILTAEARRIATEAWQRGMSAAQVVYQLAQARGYSPQNTAADPLRNPIPPRPQLQQPQPQQQQNGQQPTARQRVAATRQGQEVSRSLSGGAAAGAAQLNAEALLNMSDEEFEAQLALGSKGANNRFAQIG